MVLVFIITSILVVLRDWQILSCSISYFKISPFINSLFHLLPLLSYQADFCDYLSWSSLSILYSRILLWDKDRLTLSVCRPWGSVSWGKNPFSMVSKSLLSSVWAPVIRTQGQNSHTGCYPHFEICANCSDGMLLLVVHRVSVSVWLKVNISERYFQRTLQPSNCRVTLRCLLASANFTSLDLYSFSCKP